MNPESVMTMGRTAMEVTLMVSAPMLLVALIIGLVVSIFQAATQINEATLSFIPKAGRRFRRAGGGRPVDAVRHARLHAQVFTGIPGMIG
jgi:flagellar biosynthetic protein FliQ